MPESVRSRLRVLLVDDDEDDYVMTRDLLAEILEYSIELDWVTTYDDAMEAVARVAHDVYLFDYRLGERNGLDLLRDALTVGCSQPIILLTGQGDREVDLAAMKTGAADYLVKGEINSHLLERCIRYAIERKRTEQHILELAHYDGLTGLPNRILFKDRLQQAIAHTQRYGRPAALLFLDLDNFKRINDTLGHRAGDLLLQAVADRLRGSVRTSDSVGRHLTPTSQVSVARLGGDEFTMLLTELRTPDDAAVVASRVLDALAQPFVLDGHEVFVTASIGIAVFPVDGQSMDTLLKNADAAMYHAKEQGRNNVQFYQRALNAASLERLTLENALRKGGGSTGVPRLLPAAGGDRHGICRGHGGAAALATPGQGHPRPGRFPPPGGTDRAHGGDRRVRVA